MEELSHKYAFLTHKERIRELIVTNGYRSIAEIGAGRRPQFTPDEVSRLGLDYTIVDVSQRELDLAPSAYQKLCADICTIPVEAHRERFDLFFSIYLAEHVADGTTMHRNIYAMLRPGGRAFHYFPTLFSPAFVLNRVMPDRLTHLVKAAVDPGQRGFPKFPARYSGCFGPIPRMKRLFLDLGYEIDAYEPFYGTDYFTNFPLIREVDAWLTNWAARHRNPYLTSYAFLVLRKPERPPAVAEDAVQDGRRSKPAGGALEAASRRPGIGTVNRTSSA